MTINRRHQVFVSSTYVDLEEERREIIQALLELDCIPSGMELFPAANEDQWTLIKRVIDDCDYYLVVVAGRYGSTSDEGLSYTEMEYRYALSKGKPLVGFLHKSPDQIPAVKTESDPEKREKLTSFRALVQKKMVKFWETPSELGSVVSRSIIRLIKDNPSHGWVRGDNMSSDAARDEILNLRAQIAELSTKLNSVVSIDKDIQDNLSRGNDLVSLKGVVSLRVPGRYYETEGWWHHSKSTWNDVFAQISPLLIDEGSKQEISNRIKAYVSEKDSTSFDKLSKDKGKEYSGYEVDSSTVEMCIVQFIALNYIEKGVKRRPVQDRGTYWKLTALGEKAMYELRAIRKTDVQSELEPSDSPVDDH